MGDRSMLKWKFIFLRKVFKNIYVVLTNSYNHERLSTLSIRCTSLKKEIIHVILMIPELWNKNSEIQFFTKSVENFATVDQLFYHTNRGEYFAYWPKGYKGKKSTLQSRNSLIGNFTERWCYNLIEHLVKPKGYKCVQSIVCPEIGLTKNSPGDLAICLKNDRFSEVDNIIMLFEIKMSLVWNWFLEDMNEIRTLKCLGDYTTHQGNPSILRSDSMLKAIGKSINIRVSNSYSSKIPIVIIGNSPITNHYKPKVDHLKKSGVIQAFWSLNPNPIDNEVIKAKHNLKSTEYEGFCRMDSLKELTKHIVPLLDNDKEFFSSMKSPKRIGELIEMANKQLTFEAKGTEFLKLLRGE